MLDKNSASLCQTSKKTHPGGEEGKINNISERVSSALQHEGATNSTWEWRCPMKRKCLILFNPWICLYFTVCLLKPHLKRRLCHPCVGRVLGWVKLKGLQHYDVGEREAHHLPSAHHHIADKIVVSNSYHMGAAHITLTFPKRKELCRWQTDKKEAAMRPACQDFVFDPQHFSSSHTEDNVSASILTVALPSPRVTFQVNGSADVSESTPSTSYTWSVWEIRRF